LPRHSLNFVTCHDGFTLHDLVSYNEKHNRANGEDNRDGGGENHSWNCGIEGETPDPEILALRKRQAKNLIATLLLSQGVPMILAGDEFLRTQNGNNNAWCQDNDLSWLNWERLEKNADFLRFVRELIWLRRRHPVLRRRRFFTGEFHRGEPRTGERRTGTVIPRVPEEAGPFPASGPVRPGEAGLSGDTRHAGLLSLATPPSAPGLADVYWHGIEPYEPDFGYESRSLAFTLDGRFTGREHDPDYRIDTDFYVVLNAWKAPLGFRIPPAPTRRPWRRVIDTNRLAPADFVLEGEGPVVPAGEVYPVAAFAVLVLVSEP
jgi:glycogen operon protein